MRSVHARSTGGLDSVAHALRVASKHRVTPLTNTTRNVLRAWMRERAGQPEQALFPGPRGGPLGRDAIRRLLQRHTATAARACPSLATKTVSPHSLRHSCAMQLLRSGVDVATIAIWLGHEDIRTCQIYLHADLELKQRALARTAPPNTAPGRYRPSDPLLAFLEGL